MTDRNPSRGRRKEGNMALRWIGRVLGTLVLIGITTGAMLACIGAIYVDQYINTDLDVNLEDFQLDLTTFIYYYNKDSGDYEILDELYSSENRVWVEYEEIPDYMLDAIVAIEDERFMSHHGVDWYRTAGAFVNMFLGMKSNFGGSTITQQLIKNLTDENETIVRRKITEIFQALEFEKEHSKEDILELYLNLVYFSQGCYGVQAAAQTYFDKDVSELSLAEAAAIVGITNLPTKYDPYLNRENNKDRQEIILKKMCQLGMISEEERDSAIAQELVFKRDSQSSSSDEEDDGSSSVQSYFVDLVIEDAIEAIMEDRGVTYKIAEQLLYSSGYSIYTTIDMDIQAVIDEVYTNPEYWPNVPSKDGTTPQSAIMVTDPYTGYVLGVYGGLGEKEKSRSWSRATDSTRQPGSTMKPLAAYAPALEAGLITPYSTATDMPVDVLNGNPWPKNYDQSSAGYRGQVSIMYAVQNSLNTVPAALVTQMGADYCFDFAKYKMGLSTLVEEVTVGDQVKSDKFVASMALGGLTHGVTVRDMCDAYSIFTNKGIYTKSRTFTQILDSSGNVVIDNSAEQVAVIKEKTAYYMNVLLQNVVTRGTGINARLDNMPSAGKTGTTNDDYDRWYVGYTPYYTCTVWYGFDTNQTIQSATSPAVPLWKAVMSRIHEGLEPKSFFEPSTELVSASYCLDSGMIPSEACRSDIRGSRVATGSFYPEDVPTSICTCHELASICDETGKLATEFCPVTHQAGVTNITRTFPVSVYINDSKYSKFSMNICDVHTSDWIPPTEATEPSTGEPLTNPDGNIIPTEPGGIGSTPTSPTDEPVTEPSEPSVEPSDDDSILFFPFASSTIYGYS